MPYSCNPMYCRPQGSSVPRIFQARILEWVAISFSRGSSQSRDQTQSRSPPLQADSLLAEHQGNPCFLICIYAFLNSLLTHKGCSVAKSVMSDSMTPGTIACQASLSFTFSRIFLKFMSMESVMLSNYLILCRSLLLLPSIFPSSWVLSIASHG